MRKLFPTRSLAAAAVIGFRIQPLKNFFRHRRWRFDLELVEGGGIPASEVGDHGNFSVTIKFASFSEFPGWLSTVLNSKIERSLPGPW